MQNLPLSSAPETTPKTAGLLNDNETVFPAGTVWTVALTEKSNGEFPVLVTVKVP
nr:hypothetical protein [Bacillus sp. X1(2014)]